MKQILFVVNSITVVVVIEQGKHVSKAYVRYYTSDGAEITDYNVIAEFTRTLIEVCLDKIITDAKAVLWSY